MSKMKKVLALVCVGVLVASVAVLAACSSKAEVDKNKTYVIATDTAFAPFEYQLADGTSVGIDMDIIKAIAEQQGIKIEIKALGFDAALQSVQSGQADYRLLQASVRAWRKDGLYMGVCPNCRNGSAAVSLSFHRRDRNSQELYFGSEKLSRCHGSKGYGPCMHHLSSSPIKNFSPSSSLNGSQSSLLYRPKE